MLRIALENNVEKYLFYIFQLHASIDYAILPQHLLLGVVRRFISTYPAQYHFRVSAL